MVFDLITITSGISSAVECLFSKEKVRGSNPLSRSVPMHTVYILQSTLTQRYYIGSTNNLPRRLTEHLANQTKSLINKGPFIVVYTEIYPDKKSAVARERQIKSYKGGNAFKKLIKK